MALLSESVQYVRSIWIHTSRDMLQTKVA